MKLIDGLILHTFDGNYVAVPTDDASKKFKGFVRNNETSNYIFTLLQNDTTEDKIVDEMCKMYDAPKETIKKSVNKLINELRDDGLLDE